MTRQLLLLILGLASALDAEPPRAFDVASVKPSPVGAVNSEAETRPGGRFRARSMSVRTYIAIAWGVKQFQILGGPAWLNDRYDIDAKAEGAGEMTDAEIMLPLQALLAERFQLVVHQETRPHSVFSLVAAKNGPKLKPSSQDSEAFVKGSWRQLVIRRKSMAEFAEILSQQVEVRGPVTDNTGLSGEFDLTLDFFPEAIHAAMPALGESQGAILAEKPPDGSQITIFAALQQQLGLRLVPQNGVETMLVIDHVEKPSAN